MDALTGRELTQLLKDGSPSWLPHVTQSIVKHRFAELQQQTGLTPETYTTNRFLLLNPKFPCPIRVNLDSFPSFPYPHCSIAMEDLDEALCKKYHDLGIRFRELNDKNLPQITFMLNRALKEINLVPSLAKVIQGVVRSVNILESPDQETDCSYSDPKIPFSIFLSVPHEEIANSFLRLAESIIHECMHLQLTLLEMHIRLVEDGPNKYFSPWLNTFRPAKGLVHGIFVFRVIYDFLQKLREVEECWKNSDYIEDRFAEISKQLADLKSFRDVPELTSVGRMFVGNLLNQKINCH